MNPQLPEDQRIKEAAKQLADVSESAESAQQLKHLLDNLAHASNFESLPGISAHIREQFEADLSDVGRQSETTLDKTESKSLLNRWAGYTLIQKISVLGGLLAVAVISVLIGLWVSSGNSRNSARLPAVQTPPVEEPSKAGEKLPAPTQSIQAAVIPTQAEPVEMTPSAAIPTESASPTPSQEEYTILACVTWQSNQEVGLPGSVIVWKLDQDESSSGEVNISRKDGCAEFAVSALPQTRISLLAKPPEGYSHLQVVGDTKNVDGQAVAWEAVKEEGASVLSTTLGEEPSSEYTPRFLVTEERTILGRVVSEDGVGIPGAEVRIWSKASLDSKWDLIGKTTIANPEGTFVFTDTAGSPQVFYRVGVGNTVANRYVYANDSAAGPGDNWVSQKDVLMPAFSLVETQSGLGPDQLVVEDIIFAQKLDHVLLSVPDAILDPEGGDWRTVSAPSGQDELASKLIVIDQTNVDTLQARWENVELPAGTYSLEIWTPEDSNARVSYTVVSSGRILDERVSYQSTRQTRGEVNQWVDFSKTLNPSLIIDSPASGLITVIAKPSPRADNRDFNLSGNILFGVGPIRLVKQQ